MTAATCASVASCTIDDRPVGRLAAMAIDDRRARPFSSRPSTAASSADRAVQILGVLADDRDAVRVAVLDEHLAVAVEHHAARRAQRAASAGGCSRPSPRTSRAAPPAAPRSSRRAPRTRTVITYLQHRQPDASTPCDGLRPKRHMAPNLPPKPRLRSPAPLDRARAAAQPAETPPRRPPRCRRLPATAAYGAPKCRRSSSTYSP